MQLSFLLDAKLVAFICQHTSNPEPALTPREITPTEAASKMQKLTVNDDLMTGWSEML